MQPFHLPKAQFHAFDSPASTGTPAEYGDDSPQLDNDLETSLPENGTYAFETIDDDRVVQSIELSKPALNGAPKTMREIAEDAARGQESADEFLDNEDINLATPMSSATKELRPRRTRAATRATTSLKKRGRSNSRVTSQDDSPSPSKRGRNAETPTSSSVTGRVLRPRAAKKANKTDEHSERQQGTR